MKNLSQDVYSFGQKLNLWTPKYVAALSAFISFIVYEIPVFTSFQCPDGHFSDGALFSSTYLTVHGVVLHKASHVNILISCASPYEF
jgi:hypothetical protein